MCSNAAIYLRAIWKRMSVPASFPLFSLSLQLFAERHGIGLPHRSRISFYEFGQLADTYRKHAIKLTRIYFAPGQRLAINSPILDNIFVDSLSVYYQLLMIKIATLSALIPLDALGPSDICYPMITAQEQSYLDQDFSQDKTSRVSAEKFAVMQRGSVRLGKSLFRTDDEYEAFIENGLSVELPGVRRA
jgi:hypothetical protein